MGMSGRKENEKGKIIEQLSPSGTANTAEKQQLMPILKFAGQLWALVGAQRFAWDRPTGCQFG